MTSSTSVIAASSRSSGLPLDGIQRRPDGTEGHFEVMAHPVANMLAVAQSIVQTKGRRPAE